MKWSWVLVLIATSVGCQNQPKSQDSAPAGISPAVLNVSAPAASAYPAAAPTAAAYVPATAPEPVAAPAPIVQGQVASSPAPASSYTVKKGDTLFHIARERYGDGKRWQQIAAANPGVSPATLKAGQTLVMPQ